MKKISGLLIALTIFAAITAFTARKAEVPCDTKNLVAQCKNKLHPYRYDSQKITRIKYSKKIQHLEVEVPVFKGEKYRLVFNTGSLSKPIKINVYTHDHTHKKRKAVFTGGNELVFDAPSTRNMYVNYEIPADSTGALSPSCVMFMVGYQ